MPMLTYKPTSKEIYEALRSAEMGGIADQWIRTRHIPEGGSSAYGPVQITRGLLLDTVSNRKKNAQGKYEPQPQTADKDKNIQSLRDEKLLPYVAKFVNQANQFLKYGNEPEGKYPKEMMEKFDYGKKGTLTSEEDQDSYQRMADYLIRNTWKDAVRINPNDPVDEFIKQWKYGMNDAKKHTTSDAATKDYAKKFYSYFRDEPIYGP
jgi:hypothetical protein